MDKKGFWALLASVSKAWKTIFTRTNDSFRYRQAAGDDNILLPEKNGRAVIDTIYGNTVEWNQLVKNGDFSSGTNNWSTSSTGSISASNNSLILTVTSSSISVYAKQNVFIPEGHKYYFKASLKASINTTETRISFGSGTSERVAHTSLTANVKQEISSIKTRGTNADLRIYLDADTAPAVNDTLTINDVQIIDLTLLGIDNLTTTAQVEAWLALNVGTQDYYPHDEGSLISFKGQGVRTIKNNVELDRLDLDVTKIYGKLDGAGNYVQVFPDGMNKVTNADEINENNAKVYNKRDSLVGIDLTRHSQANCWSTTSSSTKMGAIVLSDKYVSAPPQNNVTGFRTYCLNNGISKGICSSSSQPKRIYVYDDSISTDKEFNQANANEYIIYDIGSKTYTNIIYSEDGGVTGTPLKELAYKVDKYSTEELLVPTSVNGEPTSTAIVADINYQITGHNYIDDLFVDMGLPSGTLWAKCDIDITKPNGFCDTPFTYEKTFFSWGNIDGHNPTNTSSFSPYNWGGVNAQEPWYEGQVYGSTKGNTLQNDIPVSKEYDAAMANLGQLFKMPSSTQFKELVDNCDFVQADGTTVIDDSVTDKRVTVNNIVGIYLKSKVNDNLIFFSSSGYGYGSSWSYRSNYGCYWSSSFDSSRYARNLRFISGGVYPQYSNNRYVGFAVRPIKNQ